MGGPIPDAFASTFKQAKSRVDGLGTSMAPPPQHGHMGAMQNAMRPYGSEATKCLYIDLRDGEVIKGDFAPPPWFVDFGLLWNGVHHHEHLTHRSEVTGAAYLARV